MAEAAQPEIQLDKRQWQHATRAKDLTVYWEREPDPAVVPIAVLDKVEGGGSFEGRVWLTQARGTQRLDARANIVSCGSGQWLSGTFRILTKVVSNVRRPMSVTPWPDETSGYLVPTELHVEFVRHRFLATAAAPQGAVVISGSTGSGKSDFATSLVKSVMRRFLPADKSDSGRFPHLVTFEDPIEAWKVCVGAGSRREELDLTDPSVASRYGLCVSARERPSDVTTLRAALSDARRQTPKCFYVGEVRDEGDWRHALDFAGSGHLIVLTTHAGSVKECLARIFAACDARTPAQRRQWAGSIVGVVHMLMPQVKPADHAKPESTMMPSIWQGSSAALNSLVSTGLAGLVPNGRFLLSRTQYLNQLFEFSTKGGQSRLMRRLDAEARSRLLNGARLIDVEEMVRT